MRTTATELSRRRAGERGAALVTSLLVAMLMLAAGGALLVTTGMTAANAVDSTAEAQAYYAAEAGLQAALTVIRRNRIPAGAPSPNFHNLVCGSTAQCTNSGGNLSAWLGSAGPITLSASPPMSYSVTVTDPSRQPTDILAADYMPLYLFVESVGRGPKGSVKHLQMMLRPGANIQAPGGLTMRGKTAGGTGTMLFDLGTSNGRQFHTDGSKPVFVTTNGTDEGTVNTWVANDDKSKVQFDNPTTGNTAGGTAVLPDFLASPAIAEQTLNELKESDTADDNLKIVEGDYNMTKADTSGILVVTGTLTMGGNSNFTGIILVLGGGTVKWDGDGDFTGAIFVVKYDRTKLTDFDAPQFDVKGGGKSTITYSGTAVQNALTDLGPRIAGVVEN